MEYKNRSFNIFGDNWKIIYQDKIDFPENKDNITCGLTNGDTRTIWIALKDSTGNPYPDDSIRKTLAHELMHAVLGTGQYLASNDDEPLVEWLGRCVISLIDQDLLSKQSSSLIKTIKEKIK